MLFFIKNYLIMKLFYSLFLLLCVSFFVTSCGEDGENSECSDVCEMYETGPFVNMGDCVSLCATCFNPSESSGNLAVCYCNYIEAILIETGDDWEDTGIKNKGQCVKFVNQAIKDGGGI